MDLKSKNDSHLAPAAASPGAPQEVPQLFKSSREFFAELVNDALKTRNIAVHPAVAGYLADLLNSYVVTDKLFDEEDNSGRKTRETLAEMFLKAGNSDFQTRLELLKKLGDTSLYVSGFFGDSLQRKLVDIDYYVEMGGSAYASLAGAVREDAYAKIYREFAIRFVDFVDALSYIRNRTTHTPQSNLLRLFDVYLQTGSKLAQEQISEQGIITLPRDAVLSGKARPQ